MKRFSLLLFILVSSSCIFAADVIRVNQLGYFPDALKVAVFLSGGPVSIDKFYLVNSLTGEKVFEGVPERADGSAWGKQSAYRLDFSSLKTTGGFHVQAGSASSPSFRIARDVYEGTADFPLNYMRQQRCGFNPFFADSCHVHDGIIVDHPSRPGEKIDVTGGWHDASDYLQYVTTSANAVYQMLFAYYRNPKAFGDEYLSNGLPGKNGIPDILDEARWGLEWLLKMNPSKNEMYNQIADDRDHRGGYRLPTDDTITYNLGDARPVYFVTGKPQGLGKFKNRTTGVASTAAKYASAFALGAHLFESKDPAFAATMAAKSLDAWDFALSEPGVCQTACMISPYFYEEDNYVDDMELAAASLTLLSGKQLSLPKGKAQEFLQQARYWGELEPVTPWMELHRARHYQYYPFVNLGHALLAGSHDPEIAGQFAGFMKQGLDHLRRYATGDPFLIGVPFIWCSNNLMVAAATQARLYREITGDEAYKDIETALTDWLLGCNPWGTSMICGLPIGGDYPLWPHSAITYQMKQTTNGGLVDGPVYKNIYENLRGIHLFNKDEYAAFQGGKAVYHDDMGDYSSNEPTMDGTASLTYLLSSLQAEGHSAEGSSAENKRNVIKDNQGAIIKMDTASRKVYLLFSAHDFNEGGKIIREILKKHETPASFFFTGKFYSNPGNRKLISHLVQDGHYLGAHSDGHLLYADWTNRDSLLVDRSLFESDLAENYQKMKTSGVDIQQAVYFLPPYEWYNRTITDWSRNMGLQLINFTPGIRTNADYTTPGMKNYMSSDEILKSLEHFEKAGVHGLNGCLMLVHLGTDPSRTDKFYNRLEELITNLKKKGYRLQRIDR